MFQNITQIVNKLFFLLISNGETCHYLEINIKNLVKLHLLFAQIMNVS